MPPPGAVVAGPAKHLIPWSPVLVSRQADGSGESEEVGRLRQEGWRPERSTRHAVAVRRSAARRR